MPFRLVLTALALLSFAKVTVHPATFDGRRAVIIHGGTIALGSERVRILNIDAPETRSARCEAELVAGLKAKERLAALLRVGTIEVERQGEDRYGRTLARVSTGGRDVGEVLVRERLALPWRDGSGAGRTRLTLVRLVSRVCEREQGRACGPGEGWLARRSRRTSTIQVPLRRIRSRREPHRERVL